jgi:hypothetical protein
VPPGGAALAFEQSPPPARPPHRRPRPRPLLAAAPKAKAKCAASGKACTVGARGACCSTRQACTAAGAYRVGAKGTCATPKPKPVAKPTPTPMPTPTPKYDYPTGLPPVPKFVFGPDSGTAAAPSTEVSVVPGDADPSAPPSCLVFFDVTCLSGDEAPLLQGVTLASQAGCFTPAPMTKYSLDFGAPPNKPLLAGRTYTCTARACNIYAPRGQEQCSAPSAPSDQFTVHVRAPIRAPFLPRRPLPGRLRRAAAERWASHPCNVITAGVHRVCNSRCGAWCGALVGTRGRRRRRRTWPAYLRLQTPTLSPTSR